MCTFFALQSHENVILDDIILMDMYNIEISNTFPLAIVTGAAHRLGNSFALHLARMGYAIVLHYFQSHEKADFAAGEIRKLGVPVFPIHADLISDAGCTELFDFIDRLQTNEKKNSYSLKVMVNSSAVMPRGDAKTLSMAEFDAAIALNLRAPFICSQMAYRRMENGGIIINISDIASQKSWLGYPAYTISKAGLDSMTRILARSFAPKVRVNAISPGLVLKSDSHNSEDWDRLVNRLPLQRAASLAELNGALEFLIKNEYITGQTIVIDGGYSML